MCLPIYDYTYQPVQIKQAISPQNTNLNRGPKKSKTNIYIHSLATLLGTPC